MPYVKRQANGEILAIYQTAQQDSEDYLAPDAPEIIQFLTEQSGAGKNVLTALAKSDAEIARVTEDLISLLIEKQIILFTELPAVVQEKLINRAKLRATLNTDESNFLDDSDLI